MTEKLTTCCSLCDRETETTWEAWKASHKCPKCGHGDLEIIDRDYYEIIQTVARAVAYLADVKDPADRLRLAQPITDLVELTNARKAQNSTPRKPG